MKNAYNFNENWKYISKYEFGFNYSHIYLSSAVIKENQLFLRFWNFKNTYSGISSENFSIGRRMLLDGYSKAVISVPWEENGKKIDFKNKSQTGMPLIDQDSSYKDDFQGDQVLKPCELATFPAKRLRKHIWGFERENKDPFFLQNSEEGLIRENESDENSNIFVLIIISLIFLGAATIIYMKLKAKAHKNKNKDSK
ncbi:unnamed protein product [Blepharisma stoltei]|uniref:Uncharacterized protein n=1 Tax=Blepharisma stoltei TaxID=1481888 RepID=A0AAU9J933_9CILI|nr:unnamed protein product [Blepharisma stoltei]